ncbi:glycosyltransferase family 2 protein [Bacteroides pyogenes]|uniref:glycosyltransferase family 2 protein n=1 Tax=Bacteroides pyogenes TaxID=310300 RepID=UPI0011E49DDC|nr:glycosyltransferase family 2 protein [Bacteroides pyogenes]TYK37822.1 glycosyltransferase family 2 protein [Bacteroides pyogenes]
MKISVIIPTYKPQAYLWECLDSLCKQTLAKMDFEVIIVLNGCCSPYDEIIKKYIIDHSEIYWNYLQIDQDGVSNARNLALEQARGEYIAFIDDDDYVSPEYLEELLVVVSEKTIAISKPIAFWDSTKQVRQYRITDEYNRYRGQGLVKASKVRKNFSGPCMKLIPMSFIQERRFNTRFKNGEDTLFMYLISDRFDDVIFASEKAIYYRRYRENSAVTIKRCFGNRLYNGFKLLVEMLKIYIPNFWKYDFYFSMTSFASTIHGIFRY